LSELLEEDPATDPYERRHGIEHLEDIIEEHQYDIFDS
jgi:hypothetical protein